MINFAVCHEIFQIFHDFERENFQQKTTSPEKKDLSQDPAFSRFKSLNKIQHLVLYNDSDLLPIMKGSHLHFIKKVREGFFFTYSPSLRIMGSQDWWFGDPRTLL